MSTPPSEGTVKIRCGGCGRELTVVGNRLGDVWGFVRTGGEVQKFGATAQSDSNGRLILLGCGGCGRQHRVNPTRIFAAAPRAWAQRKPLLLGVANYGLDASTS